MGKGRGELGQGWQCAGEREEVLDVHTDFAFCKSSSIATRFFGFGMECFLIPCFSSSLKKKKSTTS
jgi:hypothetical protein